MIYFINKNTANTSVTTVTFCELHNIVNDKMASEKFVVSIGMCSMTGVSVEENSFTFFTYFTQFVLLDSSSDVLFFPHWHKKKTDTTQKMNKPNWLKHNAVQECEWWRGQAMKTHKQNTEVEKAGGMCNREIGVMRCGKGVKRMCWKKLRCTDVFQEEVCVTTDKVTHSCLHTHTQTHSKTHIFHKRLSDSTPCCHSLCFIPLEDLALIFVYHTLMHVPLPLQHTT